MRGEGSGGEWALLVFGPFRRPCFRMLAAWESLEIALPVTSQQHRSIEGVKYCSTESGCKCCSAD